MNFLTLVGIALAIGGAVFMFQQQASRFRRVAGGAILLGIVLALLSSAFRVIPAGTVGVVFNVVTGVQDRELKSGLNLVMPVLQQVTLFNAREQALTFASETNDEIDALSKEGLQVEIDSTIRYRIESSQANAIYETIGENYAETLIRPQVRSVIRSAVANYKAADLISTQRADLQKEIKNTLTQELAKSNIVLIDALLRDIRIPESVSRAIEEKQTAEQQVEIEENLRQQAEIAAQREVVRAEGLRDAAIAEAEGQARALSLRGQAIRENPEIIQLEIAQRLAPTISTIMLPADSNFLLDVRSLTNNGATNGTAFTTPTNP